MLTRSWKQWSLFVTGICILLLPYIGFPQPVKNALFILFGLVVIVVTGSQLWPYHERQRTVAAVRKPTPRRSRKDRVVEPLSHVMPTDVPLTADLPHDTTT